LLNTLALRFKLLVVVESRLFRLLRRRRKATSANKARPMIAPTTAPAIVPPETFLRWAVCWSESGLRYGTGVDVTVCVTAAPETVTTSVDVTGLGVVRCRLLLEDEEKKEDDDDDEVVDGAGVTTTTAAAEEDWMDEDDVVDGEDVVDEE